jgi:hypothetical protein
MTPPTCRLAVPRARLHPPRGRVLVFLALLGVLTVGGVLLWNVDVDALPQEAPAGPAPAVVDTTAPSHRVIAYYFHTTYRCPSCRTIEAYAKEAIETGFVDDLENDRLVWRVVNVEETGNEHFVNEYELFTKSVVLVAERSGKQVAWKNLSKVWELLGDKDEFIRYIQTETLIFLSRTES